MEPTAADCPAAPLTAAARKGPPRFSWPVLALMLAFIAGANLLWYHWFGRRESSALGQLAQPAWVLVGTGLFLALLRVFRGIRLRDLSRETWIVIGSSYALFSLVWLFGRTGFFDRHLAQHLDVGAWLPIWGFAYFSINCFLARTVAALLINRYVLRRKPADIGYRLRGTFDWWWAYVVLAGVVILFVVFETSRWPAFQHKYPLCHGQIVGGTIAWEMFLVYQAFYLLIFVSGEAFWRGFILFSLERDLGYLALVYMILPYTTAHYGKPLPETMGAAVTGLVLGYLALRHRSFWLGVAAHYGVALAMDLSSLVRQGIPLV